MAKSSNTSSRSKTPPKKVSKPGPSIAVVLPCYRETGHILDIINRIGPMVSSIYVVDDACPDHTGKYVTENTKDKRVQVIELTENQGVGGAMVAGYSAALSDDHDIVVKMDGDGQMDPDLIPDIIAPIVEGRADYTKGNRFHKIDAVSQMPTSRVIGNIGLSFLSKLSSGYWSVFDPTNGFTAIHKTALRNLPLGRLSKRYFFESDMLFHLGMIRAVIEDVPMVAIYGDEESGISIPKIIPEFIAKHFVRTCKRLYFNYFLRDFGWPGLQLILGIFLVSFGGIFGGLEWHSSIETGVPATAGTVIIAALPILLGAQMLFSFLNHDSRSAPTRPLAAKTRPARPKV